MKKGLMKKGLMFVGALSMRLSSVVLLVPAMASSMRAAWNDDIPKASEEDAPYLFSDGRLDDDGHKYMLQYADLEGDVRYLYFTPDGWRNDYSFRNGSSYSQYEAGGLQVKIGGGECLVLSEDVAIVTTQFYLEKAR